MAHHTIDYIKIKQLPDGRKGIFIDGRHKDIIENGKKLNQKQAFKENVFDFADKRKGKGGKRNLKNLVFTHPKHGQINIQLGENGNLHVIDKNGDVQKIARINTALKGGMGADEGNNPSATRDKVIRSTKLETQRSAASQKSTRVRDLEIGTKNPTARDTKGYTRWNKFIKGIIHHSGPARIISATLQKFEKINNPKWKPSDGLSKEGMNFARNMENRLGVHTVNSILNMDFYPDAETHNKAHRVLEDVGLDTKKINKTLNNLLKEVPKTKGSTDKISTINPTTGKVEMTASDPGAKMKSAKINKLYGFIKNTVGPGIDRVKQEVGDFSLKGKGLTIKGAAAVEHDPSKLQSLIDKDQITTPEGTIKPEVKTAPKIPKPKNGINLTHVRRALAIGGQAPWTPVNIASDVLGGVLDVGQAVVNPTPANITHAGLGGSQAILSGLSPFVGATGQGMPLAIGMYELSNKLGQAQMQLGLGQAGLEGAQAVKQNKLSIKPKLKIGQ